MQKPVTPRGSGNDNLFKHAGIAFLIAVLVYVVSYSWIEARRHRQGPWQLSFSTNGAGNPLIQINQSKLGLTNVEMVFDGEKLSPTDELTNTVIFARPRPVPFKIAFAECVFMDTTFLPGSLTFRAYGHEFEMLPRFLMLDHEPHPWKSGERIALSPLPLNPTNSAPAR